LSVRPQRTYIQQESQKVPNRNHLFQKGGKNRKNGRFQFDSFPVLARIDFRLPSITASVDMNPDPRPDDSRNEAAKFADLVEQARNGSNEAIGLLVHRWRKYLLLIANQDLEQDLQAKIAPSDIVQQSLIDVQEHVTDFRGSSEAEFQAWVRTILKNNVAAARRKYKSSQQRDLKREVGIHDSTGPKPSLVDPQDSPGTSALQNERTKILEVAMKQIPDHYRQVIQLRNFDELTFVEIARRLGGTEDSVRKLWSRAILSLQKEIQVEYPDYVSGSFDGLN